MDTIFALATAPGKSGVAVIRISGFLAFSVVKQLCGSIPEPRVSSLRLLKDNNGLHLDQALVLVFKKGHSFTGEDVAELHLHGGPATIKAVLGVLAATNGLRLANPGEFTRRALENGCLDLAQIEGLADLLDAETEAQRKQALRVFSGALGEKTQSWRTDLIRAAALLEATIDFVDEEVPIDVMPEVQSLLIKVSQELKSEADGVQISERIRDGFEVAIIGAPNVGKSTLLNRLAGRQAAITSEIAGTTRDVIEVKMDLNGLPVTFLDTAGIRDTSDKIEGMGVDLAIKRASLADLRIFLLDAADDKLALKPEENDLIVLSKSDLNDSKGFSISGLTGQGVSELVSKVTSVLEHRCAGAATATRQRHHQAYLLAISALKNAQAELDMGIERSELIAEELHRAIFALDSLLGRVDVEHILDEIFSSFCLGK